MYPHLTNLAKCGCRGEWHFWPLLDYKWSKILIIVPGSGENSERSGRGNQKSDLLRST